MLVLGALELLLFLVDTFRDVGELLLFILFRAHVGLGERVGKGRVHESTG